MKLILFSACLVVATMVAFGRFTDLAQAAETSPGSVKAPEMTPQLNLAKMSYDAYCASCHGQNTAGTEKGPSFLHRVYHPGHHGDTAFVRAAKQGARAHHWQFGDMPAVKDITDPQIELVIKYIRATQRANGLF